MRIQHNIMAMSAYRNYTNNVAAMKKNLEKLSSGYKINRAGDDAAGLAISEKMRAQITGLQTAQKNAKDGISLVQTAEGALTEVHDMLNRMVELATMSANGTYDDTTDRAQLQKEMDQLNDEIDRIADSANFNGIKLLNGEMDGKAVKITAQASQGNFVIGGTGNGALPAVDSRPYSDLGVSTVVHKGASGNAGTNAFGVELHKLSITGDKGDTFKLTIGDAVLTGTLQADATNAAPLTGADVANALATGATTKVKFTLANGADYDKTDFTVGGAKFTAAASTTNSNTGVTFTQKAGDTATLTSVAFNVKVDTPADAATGKNPPTVTNTAGADDSKSFTGATPAAGTPLSAQASSVDMSTGTATLTDANITALTGLTLDVGGVSVSLADLELTAGTSTMTEALTAIKNAIDAAATAADTAGQAGTTDYTKVSDINVAADSNTGFKVEFKTALQTYSATGGGATSGKAVVDFGTKTGADVLGSTITVGDKTYEFVADGGTAAGGNIAVEVADDDAAAALAGKLETAAKAAAPTGVANTGIAKGTSAGVDDMKVTFTTTDTGAGNDLAAKANDTKITASVKGDYNIKTTDQSVKAPAADDRLASTNFSLTQDMVSDGAQIRIGEQVYTFSHEKTGSTANTVYVGEFKAANGTINLTKAAEKLTDVVAADSKQDTYTVSQDAGKIYVVEKNGYTKADNSQKYDLSTEKGIAESLGFNIPGGTTTRTATGTSLTLQIGDTADNFNKLSVDIQDMHAEKLGQKTKTNPDGTITIEDSNTLRSIRIDDQTKAADAIDVIKRAINQVSDIRGTLGATQNRLDHTINNLSVMTENIQDAESTIRDVDVAEEMMAYTKNNILIQSAQAMLAQANQVPQGVLQLLG